MNYKISTIILAILLVICSIWHFTAMRNYGGMMNHDMTGNPNMMHSNDTMDMSSMMNTMNANLAGKSGTDFEKSFIDEMIIHHKGAVDMAKLVLEKSKRPEMVTLANDIITAQTKEIDMMQSWRSAWFQR